MASSQFSLREAPTTSTMNVTTNAGGFVVTDLYGQRVLVVEAYVLGQSVYIEKRFSSAGFYVFWVHNEAGAPVTNTNLTITYKYYQYY